jgi:DNA-binding IclR family transcriptional regulator
MSGSVDEAVGVLDRVTAIFEAFDDDDSGLGVSELALRSGLPKSTVSRLVADLVRQRYLERDGRLVRLGLRLFELGQLAEGPHQLRAAALPVLAELRHATGATLHLAMLEGREMTYVAVLRGRDPLRDSARVGGRVPPTSPALARAVLAHAPASEVEVEVGIEEGGISTVAAPVFAPAGDVVVAAVAACGPTVGFDVARTSAALPAAALAIQRRLASGADTA